MSSGLLQVFEATPVVSIKDVVRSSVKVTEFDKHLKKAGGHIGRNVEEITITIKMKTIVRKTLMIKKQKYNCESTINAIPKPLGIKYSLTG